MPISDLLYVLRFWFVYFILGIVAFPITSRIFSRFIDRGWIFSKTIGIIVVTFLMWYLASFKILPFSYNSLLTVVVITIICSLLVILAKAKIYKNHSKMDSDFHQNDKKKDNNLTIQQFNNSFSEFLIHNSKFLILIIFEELMFFFCLFLWSYIRGFQPTIEGLEKYMDFGFINAILRSPSFPPHDMWLSNFTINYYYFGHLIAAVITKLSQIPPEIVYNLMIAVIFAFCFTSSFSIGINIFYHFLKSKIYPLKSITLILVGLLTAYLVTNAANLQPIYHLATKGSNTYWYPDATRFIVKKFGATDETIHEFPHYSFVVADLHGHVSGIPNVLLLISLCFLLFLKIEESRHSEGAKATEESSAIRRFFVSLRMTNLPFSIFHPLFLGFLLSISYMTNAMDGPVYLMLSGLTVFGTYLYVGAGLAPALGRRQVSPLQRLQYAILKSVIFFFFVALTFVICAFPFLTHFKNFTDGIKIVDFHTPLWMLGILWGFQYFIIFGFLIFLFFNKIVNKKFLVENLSNFLGIQIKFVEEKAREKMKNFTPVDLFILFLIIVSTILIIFPEIFYVKDIYIHEYERANTMFKMTYQAFIMLYIVAPYVLFRIIIYIKNSLSKKLLFPAFLFLTFSLLGTFFVSIYPYFSVKSYYGLITYQGLDGLKYLKTLYPDDYKLIISLNSPKPPISLNSQSVILEAVGDSYTKYARISANTGISTVLGWPVHEWLWRNGYDIPGKRTADVKTIYESSDIDLTTNLLKEYKVNFVWIGQLEKEKYLNLNEKKFEELGNPILRFGNSVLYKVN